MFFKLFRNFSHLKCRNKVGVLIPAYKTDTFHRSINLKTRLNVKMFMEFENNYAYNIMNNKGYVIDLNLDKEETSFTKEQFEKLITNNWAVFSPQEMFKIFPKLAVYCTENNLCISNKIFDQYIDYLTDNIKHASDHELISIFYSLKKWPDVPSVRTRNYIEVWAALDDECFKRLLRWSFDEMLSYLALFYMLNVSKFSDYCNKSLQKLATKAKQLTPAQVVQTMFFISIFRKSPFDMHNLEVHIDNHFTEFNIDELAILSMGFFKSKTPIRNMELLLRIINKVIENSKEIHEVTLAALLKLIRYSQKINKDDRIYLLLDAIQHEVPRLSVMCNVHIALVEASTLTFHEDCLTQIADTLNKNMSQSRLKDLERIVLSYAMFNFKPMTKECLFTNVINELRKKERDDEINTYGRSFICCLEYLAALEYYPVDLISRALSNEFLIKTYGKQSYTYGREVLAVSNIAKIFCKESNINLISDKDANIVAKRFTDYVPSANYVKQYNITENMFLDVMELLKESRGGDEYVIGGHILSHHQRGDIILCNDHEDRPVSVKEMFKNKMFGLIYPPSDNNRWIVLIIAGRNSMIYKSDSPTGHYLSKLKELNAVGYHAALVLWSIYSRCKTKEEKLDYFRSIIKNVTNK